MNIQLISEEIIKPSLPTPPHLRTLKLSLLDQRAPPAYIPIVLFYQAAEWEQTVAQQFGKSLQLKKSLAKTLAHFYPLAGTIGGNSSIECNDEGVQYFEGRVACQLSDIIEIPDGNLLNQFLPFDPYGNSIESGRGVVLAVKYTIFDCGGVAIGACISHKIADGTSLSMFLKAWAAIFRGSSAEVVVPRFDIATFFPPVEISAFMPNIGIRKDKVVSRRFVFDKSAITALKEKASSATDSLVKDPTRVEAVSAFIWGRLIAIAQSKPEPAKVFAVVHAVGLRDRMVPPLPRHFFGNLWLPAVAPLMMEERIDEHMLVSKLRNAIKKIDGDYIMKLQNDTSDYFKSILNYQKGLIENKMEFSSFTSWCRFPVYEVDFGWGKPTWVCSPCRQYKNLAVLMSTRDGEGIEAWLNLLEEDMAILQRDPEFLSFTSFKKE